MTQLGMSAAQALIAATAVNAKILGKEGELGSVRPGFLADLIAVSGPPADDVRTIARPQFIMKNGAILVLPPAVDARRASMLTRHGAGPPVNE
jgi:imidazolonepropionase-like amidohydrolase